VPGARFCCGDKAVSSAKQPKAASEVCFTWRAPTLQERAAPGSEAVGGTVVVKAALGRDPLSLAPDEVNPGLVQVRPSLVKLPSLKSLPHPLFLHSCGVFHVRASQLSFTLTEVEAPKKGRLLTDASSKKKKEERQYSADIVANHQVILLFFLRKGRP
jgi:hypothetical protein